MQSRPSLAFSRTCARCQPVVPGPGVARPSTSAEGWTCALPGSAEGWTCVPSTLGSFFRVRHSGGFASLPGQQSSGSSVTKSDDMGTAPRIVAPDLSYVLTPVLIARHNYP